MVKKRKRTYERIVYPHIRHIAGIEGFERPKQCEVDVDEKHLIVRQGDKERVLYYENIVDMRCGPDNTLSNTFFLRDTGTYDPRCEQFPRASRIAIRGAEMLYSVQIWYKEDGDKEPYDIVFIDDIENSKRKECLAMGVKIEYQVLQCRYKEEAEKLRKKYDF